MERSNIFELQPKAVPTQVFEDPTGNRKLITIIFLVLAAAGLSGFVVDFVVRMQNLPPPILQHSDISPEYRVGAISNDPSSFMEHRLVDAAHETSCSNPLSTDRSLQRIVAAYVPATDSTASAALAARCGALDMLFAQAYAVAGANSTLVALVRGDAQVPYDAARPVYSVLSIPASAADAAMQNFSDPAKLAVVTDHLRLLHEETNDVGVCVDLTHMAAAEPAAILVLLDALRQSVLQDGQKLCLIGPETAAYWDSASVVSAIDLAVVQTFVEGATPRDLPVSAATHADAMAHLMTRIPAEKRIFAVGGFGTAWQSGRAEPERLSYAEVMHRVAESGGSINHAEALDSARVRYVDENRRLNEIWLLDAVTFYNQLKDMGLLQGIAVWPLGYEDPAIWDLLEADPGVDAATRALMEPIDLSSVLRTEGTGPFVSEATSAVVGSRMVEADPVSGRIISQSYGTVPEPSRVRREGTSPAGSMMLTFDGLPERDDLAPLLDILMTNGIEATFFVDGHSMLDRGDALSQIVAYGHDLGMIHGKPEVSLTTIAFGPRIVNDVTQAMIAHETGARTLLIRERADGSALPDSLDDHFGLGTQIAAGYIPVVSGLPAPFGAFDAQAFAQRAMAENESGVLNFDLNTDNAANVIAALPIIIGQLKSDGVRFRPLRLASGLMADEVMPPTGAEPLRRDAVAFAIIGFFTFGLSTVFLWLMVFAALRSLVYLLLALRRGMRTSFDATYQPPVTIIVPAYNEEMVIERCIESLLQQQYENLEIIVVDDGSRDRTSEIVLDRFGHHPKVKLIRQNNAGKWAATNRAIEEVTTPFIVIADADSLFLPDTVAWLVQQFKDDSVGAVAGLVEVGNHENLLTECERIEYIVSQSVMRRAYETFEGILVVPGAVGAWRTEAVRKAGGFSGETITEDADLTVAVHRAGYRVRFQEQARSITEAPATVRSFMRQRLRWTFGMIAVSWKHRGAISEGRSVGVISIIDAVWFGLLSSVISPLVDLLLILLVVQGVIVLVSGAEFSGSGFPTMVLASYFLLTSIDLMNTLAAFWFERRFDLKLLLMVPFLRFGYRQLLYVSTLRAMWHAITGHMAGWNKLERTGTAFAESFIGIGIGTKGQFRTQAHQEAAE